jgi:bacillopeptidase F (M6 metalloprotease family)
VGKHATLQFATWFDLEQNYDYAYVEASTDGQNWTTLKGNYTTTGNSAGANWGNGYTGESGGSSGGSSAQWVQESVDLSAYVGKKVQIRFEEVTDDAVNWQGFAVDAIRIPEIGFSDKVLSDNGWVSNGFIRSQNELPEHFYMQALLYQGQTFTVTNVNVDLATGKGMLTVPNFGGKVDRVALIISASAAETTLSANYAITTTIGK